MSETKTPKTEAFASTPRGLGTGYYQALDFARELERENTELRKDKERLDWLIKQGPPMSDEDECEIDKIELSQYCWDAAIGLNEGDGTDAVVVRAAIDAAMQGA